MGAEAAIHVACTCLHHILPGHLLLLRWTSDMPSIGQNVTCSVDSGPRNLPFCPCFHLYCFLGTHTEVQQGDSLGPLLFSLTIHPMLKTLKSEFKTFYLDDGTIGAPLRMLCLTSRQSSRWARSWASFSTTPSLT